MKLFFLLKQTVSIFIQSNLSTCCVWIPMDTTLMLNGISFMLCLILSLVALGTGLGLDHCTPEIRIIPLNVSRNSHLWSGLIVSQCTALYSEACSLALDINVWLMIWWCLTDGSHSSNLLQFYTGGSKIRLNRNLSKISRPRPLSKCHHSSSFMMHTMSLNNQ